MEIKVYRRRALTLMLLILFGGITAVIVAGLVQSYFPRYTGLEDLRITDTGRIIAVIFALFMGAVTWRYATAFIRRGRNPVILVTPTYVRFELQTGIRETLYFHDVESFQPIEGNFEAAVVKYRVSVPDNSPRYPASVEVPLGLTMTRAQVLNVLNERAARGADMEAPEVKYDDIDTAAARLASQEEREARKNLPPADKRIKVYWERWAPIVMLAGIVLLTGLLLIVRNDTDVANDYLLFIKLTTWCNAIIAVTVLAGVVVLAYLVVALWSPKLVIGPDSLKYRGETVRFSDLKDVVVETKRRWVASNRYVTEHFIRFNYKDESQAATLPGLDPDMLEMRPRRIAAIINSRIKRG